MGGLVTPDNGEGLTTNEITPTWTRGNRGIEEDRRQGCQADLGVGNILPVLPPVLTDAEYSRIRDREDNTSRFDELIEILLS